MSLFKPFKALRPHPEIAQLVSCRPYDVLSREEALKESQENPLSFYQIIKPEIQFPLSVDEHDPIIYQRGNDNIQHFIQNNIFVADDKAMFYVYQLQMNEHIQTGLVGACSITDYFSNVIKKHELTRPSKEEDRKNHIRTSKMHYEPVFFAYPKENQIDEIVNQVVSALPETNFEAEDGTIHRIWKIDNQEIIKLISSIFEKNIPSIYIADGHHRTAAAALVGEELLAMNNHQSTPEGYKFFPAVLFPDDQLQILDYNRVVKDLNNLHTSQFIKKLEQAFNIIPAHSPVKPTKPNSFGMYLDKQWYQLDAKIGTFDNHDPIAKLDVSILSKNILEPILGIKDLRTDNRIDFIGGIRGLEELIHIVDSGRMKVAFTLFPVSMKQIIEVSDQNLQMPPKVTWFEPKLRSGLFVYDLENSMPH